jgi:hypothetical protein
LCQPGWTRADSGIFSGKEGSVFTTSCPTFPSRIIRHLQAQPPGRMVAAYRTFFQVTTIDRWLTGIDQGGQVPHNQHRAMASPSPLDIDIQEALARLNSATPKGGSFDIERYRQAFSQSAREKAKAVLDSLEGPQSPFDGMVPVFVSIGGADGEELDFLLNNSKGSVAVLVEALHPLAEAARKRALPEGKHIEVFEGDALSQLTSAVAFADDLILKSKADFKVITCHAVIHELYDRGEQAFDSLDFFASIFNNESIPTWFTYREPAVPPNWPEAVLVSADCHSKSLDQLSRAIIDRHPSFASLRPKPLVVGRKLRVHSKLAMELLAKLFYLEDLQHEIEERSTSIDHQALSNSLLLSIGEQAVDERRAVVQTSRGPSDSFTRFWQKLGIGVLALRDDKSTEPLTVPESHVRLIAWRNIPEITSPSIMPSPSPLKAFAPPMPEDLTLAKRTLQNGDPDLLEALLISNGRAWIEGNHRLPALSLLEEVRSSPHSPLQELWCHYLLSIATLFSGHGYTLEDFSENFLERSKAVGLYTLFRAERMEFARKLGHGDLALGLANQILEELSKVLPDAVRQMSNPQRYVYGTSHFLIANLLRSGGLYRSALSHIDLAENFLRPGIVSHDTELAHCYYARSVCYSMQGFANVGPLPGEDPDNFHFASALIRLTYSNAAWFMNDLQAAHNYAREAAEAFSRIGAIGYAGRANSIAGLLGRWMVLEGKATECNTTELDPLVDVIIGKSDDYTLLANWLHKARPSVALGLLQFSLFRPKKKNDSPEMELPDLLEFDAEGQLRYLELSPASSIAGVASQLRSALRVSNGQRVPLIPD